MELHCCLHEPRKRQEAPQGTCWKTETNGGVPTHTEVKLKNLSELQYFEFLERLGLLEGVLYAVATDAGLNQPAD